MPNPLTCLIDDVGPLPLVRPQSVPELGDLVRRAAVEGQAIYPLGGQTMLGQGLPPARPGLAVDLRGLDQVIDYPARDMTITVQAGITLTQLQELLARENQRLPVDVPRGAQATLGGALATNASGSRRYGLGTLRDYLIGVSVVNDQGHEARAGGRVVKNVAGYDLCKLYVGSFGTLGAIAQATLKLKPLPEEHALVLLRCEADAVGGLLDLLHRSRTRPVCQDLLNAAAARYIDQMAGTALPEAPWVLAVGYEDNRDAVGWQVQQLIKELPDDLGRGMEARVGASAGPLWHALVEFPAHPEARLTFKANVLPSAVANLVQELAVLPEGLLLQAHAGSGIIRGHAVNDLTLDGARVLVQRLQERTAASQGNVVLPCCPTAWKTSLPVWGTPRPDNWLMRAVKQQLDPGNLFNPGRFVNGI